MREEGLIVSEFANDPDMVELVEGFVARIPTRRAALWEAYESRNAVDLKRLAHQLKGAAGGFGFPILTSVAGTLEGAIEINGDVTSVEAQLRELDGLLLRIRVRT
ncbi:MAG: Hpt domain-containing protein [Myxococcales bacterium]|nr:Hpt domain-containing protein [Myxococcales bacterium]